MDENATLLLRFMRAVIRRKMLLSPAVMELLIEVFEITDEQRAGVATILAADIREKYAMSPHFGDINAILLAAMQPESEAGNG